MSAGTSIALATVRVPHGQPRPADDVLRRAVDADRAKLRLPPGNGLLDLEVAGPYHVTRDGQEIDEYIVWER